MVFIPVFLCVNSRKKLFLTLGANILRPVPFILMRFHALIFRIHIHRINASIISQVNLTLIFYQTKAEVDILLRPSQRQPGGFLEHFRLSLVPLPIHLGYRERIPDFLLKLYIFCEIFNRKCSNFAKGICMPANATPFSPMEKDG